MTGALLIAVYLIALAGFLGLDIVARVPATLWGPTLAALGALAGVTLVGAVELLGTPAGGGTLGWLAVGLGAAATSGGAVASWRLLSAYRPRKKVARS